MFAKRSCLRGSQPDGPEESPESVDALLQLTDSLRPYDRPVSRGAGQIEILLITYAEPYVDIDALSSHAADLLSCLRVQVEGAASGASLRHEINKIART